MRKRMKMHCEKSTRANAKTQIVDFAFDYRVRTSVVEKKKKINLTHRHMNPSKYLHSVVQRR